MWYVLKLFNCKERYANLNQLTKPFNGSNLTKMTDSDMHKMMSKNQDNAIKIKEKIRKCEESLSRNTNNKVN